LLPDAASAQNGGQAAPDQTKPIGRVQSVMGAVTIQRAEGAIVVASLPPGGVQQVKVDDFVYRNDVIQTASDGAVGIIFGDGTSFNISKNARMEISEFVYDPKGKSNSTLFNLTRGTFTFLAGKTAKTGNMRVETPVGTMGIRGTAPYVEIAEDGTVKFATLMELNKRQMQDLESVLPSVQRPTQIPSSPVDPSLRRADDGMRRTLDICRGC
jgi:hypothetical protein